MSDQQNFGFGKFVPGFDFLQNLSKGASQTPTANLSSWVAPTLNVEELDKRIGELKAVHFWLDQNSKALGATIQALELQKMTLATLKGMNFNMADIANALKLKPIGAAADADKRGGVAAKGGGGIADAANEAVAKARGNKKGGQADKPAAGVVDPMQWWGALTQQFQEIAAGAMKEAANHPAVDAPRAIAATATAASSSAGTAQKTASRGKAGAPKGPARKSGARSR